MLQYNLDSTSKLPLGRSHFKVQMGETQESHSKFGDPLGPYMSPERLFHSVTCGQSSILLHFLFTQEIFQITENSLKQ